MLLKTGFNFLFNSRYVVKGTEEDSRKLIPRILNIEKKEKKTLHRAAKYNLIQQETQ